MMLWWLLLGIVLGSLGTGLALALVAMSDG